MEIQKAQDCQKNLGEKRAKLEGSHFLITPHKCDFKTYKKANINVTDIPEINPYIYGQPLLNKDAKKIQWKINSYFQNMVMRQLDIHIKKKEKK